MRERPYDLTSVFGIGFQTADTIARSVNVPADAPARAHAGVLHVLSEAERAGSTCLPVAELAVRAGELLGTAPDAKQLGEMADAGTLVIELSEADAGAPRQRGRRDARHGHADRRDRRGRGGHAYRRAGRGQRGLGLPPRDGEARARPRRDRPRAGRRAGESQGFGRATRRRPRPRARAGGRGPRRVRLPTLDRHRRPGHGQDRDDPADLRGRFRAEGVGAARRPDRPGRTPDVRVERPRRLHGPLRPRLDPRPGPDRRRARRRPPDRRRDLDGQPRAARHAAARRRPGHARRPRRRRRPARTGRSRQAVRRARRGPAGPDRRAHPHLPPGGGKHDRPRSPRRAHRAARRRSPRPRR